MGRFIPSLIFLHFSSYEPVRDRRTDRQTDRRIGKTRNAAYKGPHKNTNITYFSADERFATAAAAAADDDDNAVDGDNVEDGAATIRWWSRQTERR